MSQHFDQKAFTHQPVELPPSYDQAVTAYEQSLEPPKKKLQLDADGGGSKRRKGWQKAALQGLEGGETAAPAAAAATKKRKKLVNPVLVQNRFKRLTGDEAIDELLRAFDRETESQALEESGAILERQRRLERTLLEIHAEFEQTKVCSCDVPKRKSNTTRSMTAGVAAALTYQYMKGRQYCLPAYDAAASIREMAQEKPGAFVQALDFLTHRLRFRDIAEGEEKASFAQEVLDVKLYYWYENLMAKAKKYGVWHEGGDLSETRLMGIYYRHYRVLLMIHPKIESVRRKNFPNNAAAESPTDTTDPLAYNV